MERGPSDSLSYFIMKLIATREHRYPPMTQRKVGDEYEASKGDAVVLVAFRNAKYADETKSESRPTHYETKEQVPEPVAKEKPIREKRKYQRKEMTPAE